MGPPSWIAGPVPLPAKDGRHIDEHADADRAGHRDSARKGGDLLIIFGRNIVDVSNWGEKKQ